MKDTTVYLAEKYINSETGKEIGICRSGNPNVFSICLDKSSEFMTLLYIDLDEKTSEVRRINTKTGDMIKDWVHPI